MREIDIVLVADAVGEIHPIDYTPLGSTFLGPQFGHFYSTVRHCPPGRHVWKGPYDEFPIPHCHGTAVEDCDLQCPYAGCNMYDAVTPTIGVYAIAKNEQAYVKSWLESVKDADYILVTDTGSTDGTRAAFEQTPFSVRHGSDLKDIMITPFRFDMARNAALALMPPWIDICVALDLDETISTHWKEAILDTWSENCNNLCTWYQNSEGYEGWDGRRIHSRNGWIWRHPVHEQLYPYLQEPKIGFCPDITIKHPRTYLHDDYLPLCELALKEDPSDAHAQYFCAREFYNVGRYDEAVALFQHYLEQDTEREERRQAKIFLRRAQDALDMLQ